MVILGHGLACAVRGEVVMILHVLDAELKVELPQLLVKSVQSREKCLSISSRVIL